MSTGTVRASTVPRCAHLGTSEQLQRQTQREKLEVQILYLHCFYPSYLRNLPRCSPDMQDSHSPLVPGQILRVSPITRARVNSLLHRFLALNLSPTLAMWCSCMRSIFSFAFSPNSSQLGQGSSQKGKSGGLSRVKVYRGLLLGSLNTISLF